MVNHLVSMKHQINYFCVVIVLIELDLSFGSRRLCEAPWCKQLNSHKPLSFPRPRQYELNDDAIDYDDKHTHFKHFRHSKKNHKQSLSVITTRHMSDIRARNQISDSNKHFVKTTALLHPRTFPFPEAVKKCLKCGTEPSEPQCGTDRKEYENSCYRECATPPSLGQYFGSSELPPTPYRVDVLFMGKCPQCDCKQTWETECVEKGSADHMCLKFCKKEEYNYSIHCSGRNGPCICPNIDPKAVIVPDCGTDGIFYDDGCRRECAGVAKTLRQYCKCDCYLVWSVLECGHDLGFEANFSIECQEKCRKKRIRVEKQSFIMCQKSQRKICQCDPEHDDKPVCGHDFKLYPNGCAMKCAVVTYLSRANDCPNCNCLESLWSKECGVTDYLPIHSDCRKQCPPIKRDLAKRKIQISCSKTTPKKACACSSRPRKECGADGKTYINQCQRECEDVPFAYTGECMN